MPEKFFSFEQALRELNLREEELKRLVSEGEIRAFRDGDKMKFRKEDVDRISTKASAGGETVADAEDLIFDEEDGLELEDEPGMATAPISSPVEEIEQVPPPRPAAKPARAAAPAPSVKKTPSRQSRVRQVEATAPKSSPIMLVLLVVSSLTLLYGVFVMLSAASSSTNSMTKGFADTMYSMGFAQKS